MLSPIVRRRVRWAVFATLLAIVLYPLSLGPASYFMFRDATPRVPFAAIYRAFYAPLWAVANGLGHAGPLVDYENYYIRLAIHHDGRDVLPVLIPPFPREDLPK